MCGIVGAVAERNVVPILMEGLRRLEYRGYDSAGIAIHGDAGITRVRRVGKVQELQSRMNDAQQKLREGLSLYDATVAGARIRFRPIVMTSLAFIGGTLPLALSTGAGANSRHIIGTTVVSGMVVLTVIAVFFIPLFYYLIMRSKAKFSKKGAQSEK